ncbi:MAG: glycosyltransferase family 9 protein [Chitinophagaceae bacterium]
MIKTYHILICRNDAIGDTVLALPMCGVIKKYLPQTSITFLGTAYTRPVVAMCQYVDDFIDYNEIKDLDTPSLQQLFKEKEIDSALLMKSDKEMAHTIKRSGIRYRIGMLTWLKHWSTCNRFVNFSRSKSNLNEAQLNLKMLTPLGIHAMMSLQELSQYYGFTKVPQLEEQWKALLGNDKFNLILHPKTTGHGREWPLDHFTELIHQLDKNRFRIFVSGAGQDAEALKDWDVLQDKGITDLTGKMPLTQFLAFIHAADGLVAGSTGPVHLAAAFGIHALGLYTNLQSRNANRWFPVGALGESLECANDDMTTITVDSVLRRVNNWRKETAK